MAKRNKLVEGIVIGAAVGAALSLLDKETRETTIENAKSMRSKAVDVIKHPAYVTSVIQENLQTVRDTVNQVTEDFRFLSGKVNELNESTPEMINLIKDTGQVFTRKNNGEEEATEKR